MNKKIILFTTLTLLLASCSGGKVISVENILLSEDEISISVEGQKQITATVLPEDATNKSFTWESENSSVAYVYSGLITGVSVGETYITATTKDGGKIAKCHVVVTEKEPEVVHVSGVVVNKTNLELEVGNSDKITATVIPSDADNKNVIWSILSYPENAVSVDNGVVTANEVGTAIVTVTTEDGGYTAMTTVTVKGEEKINVTGVKLNKESTKLAIDETQTLVATVLPQNASDKEVSWESSDSSVVSVEDGLIKGVSSGTATVTVTTHDGGFSKSCSVEVSEKPAEEGVKMYITSSGKVQEFSLEKSSTGVNEYYISHTFKDGDLFNFETNDGIIFDAANLKSGSSNRFAKNESTNDILALTSVNADVYVELSDESSAGKGIYLADKSVVSLKRSSLESKTTMSYDSTNDVYYLDGLDLIPNEKLDFSLADGTNLDFSVAADTNYLADKGVRAGSSNGDIFVGFAWNPTLKKYQLSVSGLETNFQISITRDSAEIFYILVNNPSTSNEFMAINIHFEKDDLIKAAYQLGSYGFNLYDGGASSNFEKQADGSYKVLERGDFNCYLGCVAESKFEKMYIEKH